MAVRKPGFAAQVACTLFTSLVAPVLVSLAVRDLNPEGAGAARPEHTSPGEGRAAVLAAEMAEQVVGSGEGRTADEALREAVRNALRLALASRPGAPALGRGDSPDSLLDAAG